MKSRPAFPPGLGWLAIALIGGVLAVASFGAIVPQFRTKLLTTTRTESPSGAASTSGAVATSGGKAGQSGANTIASSQQAQAACAGGHNAGATAPGVTSREIHVASTIVTTGVGSGFLGQAVYGIQAAIKQANNAGGICGRRVTLETVNSGWKQSTGHSEIDNYIHQGNVFALVGEPDSEGLDAAVTSGDIDAAKMPVVGTDGMLKSQYQDPWVWPVAASTVSNMHIIADYGYYKLHARKFAIVYDTLYRFGTEGAHAFAAEVKRISGQDLESGGTCGQGYCGISADSTDYTTSITQFNTGCHPCDLVVMLLEPAPMETWMKQEQNNSTPWYSHLMGGEPLFDDNVGNNCTGCAGEQGQGPLQVWTGYRPAVQPFDTEKAVNDYRNALLSTCPSCDPHNEFTEGAYLGTLLFLQAAKQVGPVLTRAALKEALDSQAFDFGLATPLTYARLPHIANDSMAAFAENATGSTFNGWNYLATGFLTDPAPGRDFQ